MKQQQKAVTEKAEKKGKELSYYEAVDLRNLLTQKGYNTADVESKTFTRILYLSRYLKSKINEITETVEEYAKQTDHEVVPLGDGRAQYMHVKKLPKKNDEERGVGYEAATKEFIAKKRLLEDVIISGLDLNFMKLEEFRTWVGKMENQFDLAEYLVEEDLK